MESIFCVNIELLLINFIKNIPMFAFDNIMSHIVQINFISTHWTGALFIKQPHLDAFFAKEMIALKHNAHFSFFANWANIVFIFNKAFPSRKLIFKFVIVEYLR